MNALIFSILSFILGVGVTLFVKYIIAKSNEQKAESIISHMEFRHSLRRQQRTLIMAGGTGFPLHCMERISHPYHW